MAYKKAFSLLELIFAIVIIGIISTVAVPKLMDTKANAEVAIIKKDIATIVSSVRSYYLVNDSLDDFTSALTLNQNIWEVDGITATFNDNETPCITISIEDKKLNVIVANDNSGKICEKIKDSGIASTIYEL
ncbi:MAG: prepilin-type cleavage/methylation domain-containing protein [Arcobacter sp.]|mgnify:CR=1 FL=1|uniref:prepilin-type N-terminal cleavage/methylation domain-containing protein n=1 Tax=uncultured Arcobacter sp. TaxID=165434 RepID=UPI000CBF20CF|nr:prepilin-type N-terminal cleavage/methylation domain-containing protein [uncultured Arcobacter sp.]PLY09226.1 MAG: prepilin-type cleavage/methylation domain-containing protein [Arcobacter sp.]